MSIPTEIFIYAYVYFIYIYGKQNNCFQKIFIFQPLEYESCEYVTLPGNRDFANVIEDFDTKRLS